MTAPEEVIAQAGKHNEEIRVFSFGLGHGCDANLVREVARSGRGSSTIVQDNDTNLNGLVIRALSQAMEPSYKETRFGFNGKLCKPMELYRNVLVCESTLMTPLEFSNLKFTFTSKCDEVDRIRALELWFRRGDFHEVKNEAAKDLFKIAAHHWIQNSSN